VTSKASKGAATVSRATTDASEAPTRPAQPGPWDAPWQRKEDATGWEAVYRGTGQRRTVKNELVLELTPEQWVWLNRRARAAHDTPHSVVKQLIDEASATDPAGDAS